MAAQCAKDDFALPFAQEVETRGFGSVVHREHESLAIALVVLEQSPALRDHALPLFDGLSGLNPRAPGADCVHRARRSNEHGLLGGVLRSSVGLLDATTVADDGFRRVR